MDLKTRAINMITKPADEWPVVAAESQTIESLIKNYAAPLAAIPAIAGFIGRALLSAVLPSFGFLAIGIVGGVVAALLQWVLALVGVFVCTLVVEFLAPNFNSTKSRVQAMKLVVFAMTPAWVGGVFQVLPLLGSLLALVAGLYAIYVFYLGFPPVLNTPPSQVIPYMAICVLVMIVIFVMLAMITTALTLALVGAAAIAS